MSGPTLAEDEHALERYAHELLDALDASVGDWIRTSIARFDADAATSPEADAAVAAGHGELMKELRTLLTADIADQTTGPLDVLRRGTRFATDVLREAAVEPPARDGFAERAFPADVYALAPASFGDVDPRLHEPGLVWGAAKAHVHLRRRREREAGRVIALALDLMDRSKIVGAFPEVEHVRDVNDLIETASGADLVLVDLSRIADPAVLDSVAGRVIAFGSHVDDERLAAAEAAGAEAVPRSVFFKRIATGEV